MTRYLPLPRQNIMQFSDMDIRLENWLKEVAGDIYLTGVRKLKKLKNILI